MHLPKILCKVCDFHAGVGWLAAGASYYGAAAKGLTAFYKETELSRGREREAANMQAARCLRHFRRNQEVEVNAERREKLEINSPPGCTGQ